MNADELTTYHMSHDIAGTLQTLAHTLLQYQQVLLFPLYIEA